MKIVDVDIKELEQARRRGRSRSPETMELIKAIEALAAGQARGIRITADMPEKGIRSRLAYASRIANKRIEIASDGTKVMFTPSARPARRRRRSSSK